MHLQVKNRLPTDLIAVIPTRLHKALLTILGDIDIYAAYRYAEVKHKGQKRKFTGEDYIMHPLCVACYVYLIGGDKATVIAAILHDVVEDTELHRTREEKLREITVHFGQNVSYIVDWVTKVTTKSDGNRNVRCKIENDRLKSACSRSQTLKSCDIHHNMENILASDNSFALRYIDEKLVQLGILKDAPRSYVQFFVARILELKKEVERRA